MLGLTRDLSSCWETCHLWGLDLSFPGLLGKTLLGLLGIHELKYWGPLEFQHAKQHHQATLPALQEAALIGQHEDVCLVMECVGYHLCGLTLVTDRSYIPSLEAFSRPPPPLLHASDPTLLIQEDRTSLSFQVGSKDLKTLLRLTAGLFRRAWLGSITGWKTKGDVRVKAQFYALWKCLSPKPLMVPQSITHTQTLTPACSSGWELPEAPISVNNWTKQPGPLTETHLPRLRPLYNKKPTGRLRRKMDSGVCRMNTLMRGFSFRSPENHTLSCFLLCYTLFYLIS